MISCNSQKINKDNFQRQWMLISFKNFGKDFLVKNKAQLDLTKTNPDNQYKAYMGCNKMMMNIEFKKDGSMNVGDVTTTQMYCEDNNGLEKSFIYEIAQAKKYKIEGHFLILSDENDNQMKFIASDWD